MSKKDFDILLENIDLSLKIQELYEYQGTDIFLLREDLINFSYGGNKIRLAIEILKDFYKKGATAILSYGSLESNFNRIMADFCKNLGIKCYILSSLSDDEFLHIDAVDRKKCLNEKLCEISGAKRYFCKKSEVKESLAFILDRLKKEGEKAYYIYGDLSGTANDEILKQAYFNVYNEIAEQNMDFKNIVLAYGTGMSFFGLSIGKKENTRKYNLYGISIARNIHLSEDIEKNYIIPKYIGSSYASSNKKIEELIIDTYNKFNISFDPVYTGKAFYGMLKEIEEGNISGKTLFIHSGGYPIFKDFWEKNR